jgi:tRNA dimethylallyltransferase
VTRHLALVGPTATGKSELALEVAAAAADVEIVSLDSMQVYRGMDIGTAKPTPAQRAAVPHHLVDVADPAEVWSVARTQRLARAAIADIETRGQRALLVGGTGLYVRAVVDDLAIPGQDLDIRARWFAATADESGLAAAHARLRSLDPVAAEHIEPNNRRRIVRALEVIDLTGRPFSSFGPGFGVYQRPVVDVTLVGLWFPRPVLAERIASRFAAMRAAGLVDEVRTLLARPGGLSLTAAQAIGYAEAIAYLRGDEPTLDGALARAVQRTRQFARRQRMWFRRDPRVHWIAGSENPREVLPAILATWTDSVPATTA